MSDFIEFDLEVINLAQDVAEASDFCVGSGDRRGGTRGLVGGRALRLGCELWEMEWSVGVT